MSNINLNKITKPITVEKALRLIPDYLEIEHVKIEGRVYTVFEEELLDILNESNIKTIDKIGFRHLVLLILTVAKKYHNSISVMREMCKQIFLMFELMGLMPHENNPAIYLDDFFRDSPWR